VIIRSVDRLLANASAVSSGLRGGLRGCQADGHPSPSRQRLKRTGKNVDKAALPAASWPSREQKRMPATRSDAEERWHQILESATKLFRRKGFAGTTMQDVSDAVGLLKGSLYHYIRSKEELLFHVLKGLHIDAEQIIEMVDFNSGEPIEQLRLYLKNAAIFGGHNADRLTIFLRDFDHIPPERRQEILIERELFAQTVERLLDEADKAGLLRQGLDLRLIATLVSGAISSTHVWLNPKGRRPIEEAADEISHVLIEGFLEGSSPRRPLRGNAIVRTKKWADEKRRANARARRLARKADR
jgi:AcrR family transcriptional regulator